MGRGTACAGHLVGRQEELAQLTGLLTGAGGGRAATVLLTGEAGMGKTRLVHELAGTATASGFDVLVGSCLPLGSDVLPFAPFVEVLADLVRSHGTGAVLGLAGPTADELVRLAPALGGTEPPAPSRAGTSRLLLALGSLVEGLARARPLLLVVEDVHWSDASTRDLLVLLAAQLRGRVLLLLTLRTDEVTDDDALRQLVAAVERSAALRVDLPPLTRDEQARQLSGLLGVPPTVDLLERVWSRAEGNPFFAEQLVALGDAAALPSTVRELLLARLHSLPAPTRQALRAAAATGREVGHRLLDAVADVHGEALDDALRPAVDAGIVLADPARGSYRFRHALLHEAVTSTLLPGESARLHGRLAEVLTADPGLASGGSGVAGRVALHWQAAGDAARTLTCSVAAADEAERSLAWAEALRHYDRAIDLLDAVPDADALLPFPRYHLLWQAAAAAHLSAYPQRAAELAEAALAVVDPAQLHHAAYLHERLGRYLWMCADGEAAMREYQRAVELVPKDPVSCWQAAILSGWSQILMLAGCFAESREWAQEAIRIAGLVDDGRSTEGHARNNLGVCLAMLGEVDAGIEQLLLARRIAEQEMDDVDDIARAAVNLHSVLFDAGRLAEAAEVSLDAVQVVDRLGLQRRKGIWCRCDAAQALLLLGRCTEAEGLLEESLSLEPEGIDALRLDSVRGQLDLRRGELPAAQQDLESARRRAEHVLDGHLIGPLLTALMETLRRRGQPREALAVHAEGSARLAAAEHAPYAVPLHAAAVGTAGDVAARSRSRGQHDRAREAVDLAEAAAEQAERAVAALPAVLPPTAASLLEVRAELARARGEAAPEAWAAVAESWAQIGDQYRSATARWRQAEAFLEAGAVRAAATAAASDALRTAAEIGARHLQDAVSDLVRRARLPIDVTPPEPASGADAFRLTRREREVLELVAQGRTDRQVGEALFISHRTVERHVSNLLAKLDASTRAELTALAHRDRLVPSL